MLGQVSDLRTGGELSHRWVLLPPFPIALKTCSFLELLESGQVLVLIPIWLAVSSVYTQLSTGRIM